MNTFLKLFRPFLVFAIVINTIGAFIMFREGQYAIGIYNVGFAFIWCFVRYQTKPFNP